MTRHTSSSATIRRTIWRRTLIELFWLDCVRKKRCLADSWFECVFIDEAAFPKLYRMNCIRNRHFGYQLDRGCWFNLKFNFPIINSTMHNYHKFRANFSIQCMRYALVLVRSLVTQIGRKDVLRYYLCCISKPSLRCLTLTLTQKLLQNNHLKWNFWLLRRLKYC